jgi:Reverse transcriptase (RNA-dependent DNA polymerase)
MLKKNFGPNCREIFDLESQFSSIIEIELREELESYKVFDRLNNEKITPHFMRMAKTVDREPCLSEIKGNSNENFINDRDREEYLTGFYSNLYKKTPVPVASPSIEEFLGDLSENEQVQNSKISPHEKLVLDSPLTIFEFDNAIKKANKKSAPGTDGISNVFIAKFWEFFRVPLMKYANCCYEKGVLTSQFKTAKIRIIPKKGDISQIGNWRPISLLNCFYKIISRVIAHRLRKVMDKITNLGQYGYSTTKQCQEVLIGLLNKIHCAKRDNESRLIISLDIKKAFDSISHDFLEKALIFFNFGDNFIRWIKVLCTNREACLIFTSNKLGSNFRLERGNTQGDILSPFLFNICYQVLLLKLELDLQIKGIPNKFPVAAEDPAVAQHPPVSSHGKKVFAFADDCNLAVLKCKKTVESVINTLSIFAGMSGLECNLDKTNFLEIGTITNAPDLPAIEIKKRDSLKILGMMVSNEKELLLNAAADQITKKINNQVTKWSRFNLSLPGRIRITKTMLLSQINYLGCFLDFPQHYLKRWETIIFSFAAGNLRISKERVFLPCEKGGLGLPVVDDFIAAQKCSWILRASKNNNAEWRELIRSCTTNSYLNLDLNKLRIFDGIFSSFGAAMKCFRKGFVSSNNNYLKVPVFSDELFTVNTRSQEMLNFNDIDPTWNAEQIRSFLKIQVKDLYDDGNILNRVNLSLRLGYNVSADLYKKLSGIGRMARMRYHNVNCLSGVQFSTFTDGWKKGSKKIRNYISFDKREFVSHNVVKFASNIETVIDLECAKKLNLWWTCNYFNNATCTFLFKLTNNVLPVNTILSHIVRGQSRNCGFGDMAGDPEVNDETVLHLFFDCPVTEQIQENFFKWLIVDENFIQSRHEFFCCMTGENKCRNKTLMIVNRRFLNFLWDCKLRKNLPVLGKAKKAILREIDVMVKCNAKIKNVIANSGIDLSLERAG